MIRVSDIVEFLNADIRAISTTVVGEPQSLDWARIGDITFCTSKYAEKLKTTNASTIICDYDLADKLPDRPYKNFILSNNARYDFIRMCWEFFPPPSDPGPMKIGKNVRIRDGAKIGYSGFGYERHHNGSLIRFPHYGGVFIGNDVDIGHSSIDRGTFGDTQIWHGTKIDNEVHIAHNVQIGQDCEIVAGTVIGGGVKIGDGSFLGIGCRIRDNII